MLTYLLGFLILLTIVVFIHEYGHYYFARKYGVGVTVFSVGFGQELFGYTDKHGTRWKFSAIPFGGYVKFFGDHSIFSDFNREELRKKYNEEEQKKLLAFKPLYQRNLIAFGGPFANFILAFVILLFFNMFVGKDFTPPKISEIEKDGPAEVCGLKANDTLVEIDGYKVNNIMDVSKFIMLSTDEFIDFVVLRNDIEYKLKVKPKIVPGTDGFGNPIKEKRMVGIRLAPTSSDSINYVKLGPTKAAYYAVAEIAYVSKKTLVMAWGYIQKLWGKGFGDLSQLGGPIKIAEISGKAFGMGILPFIHLMVYISISLGLFNLFPIPLLDGGHIALNTIEGLRGKEFNKKTLELTFRIGMTLIASLMIFATFNDLSNNLHKITGYFGGFFN